MKNNLTLKNTTLILISSLFTAGMCICVVLFIYQVLSKPVITKPERSEAVSTTARVSIPEPEIEIAVEPEIESEPETEPVYTEDELFCMAATIYNEAGSDSCSDDTRRLVGYVVMNRVKDPRYPNTIREVLEQPAQYGLFSQTGVKFPDRCSSPQEQHAVERAYSIAKEVLETENIPIPSSVVFQAEFIQGTSIYKQQDGFYFCYAEEVK